MFHLNHLLFYFKRTVCIFLHVKSSLQIQLLTTRNLSIAFFHSYLWHFMTKLSSTALYKTSFSAQLRKPRSSSFESQGRCYFTSSHVKRWSVVLYLMLPFIRYLKIFPMWTFFSFSVFAPQIKQQSWSRESEAHSVETADVS